MTNLSTVDFHGTHLTVVIHENQNLVAMKPICEAIGLAWNGQWERIKRDDVLSEGIRVLRTPTTGGEQDTIFLPLELLNGWLFGISINHIKSKEARNRLRQYKRECYQVLYDYWNEGAALNPRAFSVNPNDTLTADEQATIRSLLQSAAAKLPKNQRAAFMIQGWSKLKSHFKTSYRQIPREEFSTAVSLVARHHAEWEILDAETTQEESLTDTVNKWAKQVTTGNGIPPDVFMPLVDAVLSKTSRYTNQVNDAYALASQAGARISQAVFEHLSQGLDSNLSGRWIFHLGYGLHNERVPGIKAIPDDACILSFKDFAKNIESGEVSAMASNAELLAVASACTQRVEMRLRVDAKRARSGSNALVTR